LYGACRGFRLGTDGGGKEQTFTQLLRIFSGRMSIFISILNPQLTMTPQDVLNAAKQGNPEAIAALMNRSLQTKGITARAKLVAGTLQVMLEGNTAPSKAESVAYVAKGIKGLEIPGISHLMIAGKSIGAENLEWTERIELIPQQQAIQAPKISTSPKKENPQSTPGRPASGLKYQANSSFQKIQEKLEGMSLQALVITIAGGFLATTVTIAVTKNIFARFGTTDTGANLSELADNAEKNMDRIAKAAAKARGEGGDVGGKTNERAKPLVTAHKCHKLISSMSKLEANQIMGFAGEEFPSSFIEGQIEVSWENPDKSYCWATFVFDKMKKDVKQEGLE
jgi:hypothetical protein